MEMTPADLSALGSLLDVALELAPGEREAWLAGLDPAHAHLRSALKRMLEEGQKPGAGGFLSTLPDLGSESTIAPAGGTPSNLELARAGERVGPYRLLREIGRGGMGTVWLAERADGNFKRQVALKLPRLVWGAGLADRMAREREIGAMLEHPHIARLYDAGVDEIGRPFIAMEYIEGQTIDVYCRDAELALPDRVKLIVQVAQAVAYAHGRLVVHRDLKPSNVLIAGDGQAHLLDFGIAKLLDDANDEEDAQALHPTTASALTSEQGRVLTIRYAAPEQLRGEPVTVQTDVYGLGMLAFEALAGAYPYDEKLRGPALEAAILQGDSALPSTRCSNPAVQRALKGDLDAIVAKAIEAEPSERYRSAEALAEDLQRWQQQLPVQARPDSLAYRLRKAWRRHWVGFSATAAVLAAVITAVVAWAVHVQRAADAAGRQKLITELVAEYMRVDSQPGPPGAAASAAQTAASAIDSVEFVERRTQSLPVLRAEMHGVLAGMHMDMGVWESASRHFERQLLALEAAGASPSKRAAVNLRLAAAQLDLRQLQQAAAHAQRAQALSPNDRETRLSALVLQARAATNFGMGDSRRQFIQTLEDAIAEQPAASGIASAWLVALKAVELRAKNRMDQALPLLDEAIAAAEAAEGPHSLAAVDFRLTSARLLTDTNFDARATAHFEHAARVLQTLGGGHAIRGKREAANFAEARALSAVKPMPAEKALAIIRSNATELRQLRQRLPAEVEARLDLAQANVLSNWGSYTAALPLFERSAPLLHQSLSPNFRFASARQYGRALAAVGRHDEARRWMQRMVQARADVGQAKHPAAAFDFLALVENLRFEGLYEEALAELDKIPAFENLRGIGSVGADRLQQQITLERSAIFLGMGRIQEARAVIPIHWLDDDASQWRPIHVNALVRVGVAECRSGLLAAGLEKLTRAIAKFDEAGRFPGHPQRGYLRGVAGQCALALGDRSRAAALAAEAREVFTLQPGVRANTKAPWMALEAALAKQDLATKPQPTAQRAARP